MMEVVREVRPNRDGEEVGALTDMKIREG